MYQDILPLSLEGDWHREPAKHITNNLSGWLFEPGSLTQKLKLNSASFRVKILAKHQRELSEGELTLFGCQQQAVQVREVLLYCNEEPWVYAQTLMPLANVPKSVVKLTTLGEKPLGEVIFNEPGMTRSLIEVAEFDLQSPVAMLAAEVDKPPSHSLWARRSCFTVDGYSLLVAEVYLPCAVAYR
ncbi:MAG: chorismate lyase [Algicola sp.]|nr:chorismate lyase [Algicola sp.]